MDIVFALIRLLGGLALFLYGMDIMGAGLKNSSASVLKKALDKVTSNTFMSFLLGFAITVAEPDMQVMARLRHYGNYPVVNSYDRYRRRTYRRRRT